ncbi:MAG: type I-B CRISPR-associated protein Cas8b1/Cst1 [Saprospiraceae bacterium]|nr:type I-B CRISPR-associated protein Cas8b1/Cst1 [Saprospiraceae bacterium]
MIKTLQYNPEWLFKRTGDPFADAGAVVIREMQKPDEDLIKTIERATRIYVDDWGSSLQAFFLNSTITHTSNKGEKGFVNTMDFFKRLLADEEPYEVGYCRILGEKTKLFRAGRDNHILSGSGTYINFHHGFQDGLKVSKEILIRIFFLPLGVVSMGKIAVLGCNRPEIEAWFVQQNYRENIHRIGQRQTDGVLKSEFSNPANALFEFVQQYLAEYEGQLPEEEPVEIHLYHFTNFAGAPNIELHCFSAPLFQFYRKMRHRQYAASWKAFIRDQYFNSKQKGAIYNAKSDQIELETKKEKQAFGYEEFKTWYNPTLQKLLRNDSILRDFLRWCGKQYQLKQPFSLFPIVELYQIELRNMKKSTLDKIREIADYLVSGDADKIKKRLNALRLNVSKPHELRRFLIKTIGEYYLEKNPDKSLISLEEFVTDLFPDGSWGMEIRDLLLIAVYEKLCAQNITVEIEEGDEVTIIEIEQE